jgi:hypothetical protein
MDLHTAIIATDKTSEVIGTMTSILNQSAHPRSLLFLENTLSGTRTVPNTTNAIWALLDAFTRRGVDVSVHLRNAGGLVENRVYIESIWSATTGENSAYLISDDDHVYPYDYFSSALDLLSARPTDPLVYAGLVETWITEDCTDRSSRYGQVLEDIAEIPNMTSGGSAIYTRPLLGAYGEVLKSTSGNGEDWLWRDEVFGNRGAERLDLHPTNIIHLAKWSPFRWGSFVKK